MIKTCVAFSLQSFGTAKTDYVINAKKMFSFLPLINILNFTIELSFLFIIYHSNNNIKDNQYLTFFPGLYLSTLLWIPLTKFEHSIKLYNLYNALSLQFHGF